MSSHGSLPASPRIHALARSALCTILLGVAGTGQDKPDSGPASRSAATAETELGNAKSLIAAGRNIEARDLVTQILARPDISSAVRAAALTLRGGILCGLGDAAGSLRDALALLQIEQAKPDDRAWALMTRATSLSTRGESAAALADLAAALALDGVNPSMRGVLFTNRGVLLGQSGQHSAALEHFDAAARIEGAAPEVRARARTNRAVALSCLGDNEAALRDLRDIILDEELPDEFRAEAHVERGKILGRLGQREAAITDYTHVIDMANVSPSLLIQARINRGAQLQDSFSFDLATVDYVAAIDLDGAPPAWREMAVGSTATLFRQVGWAGQFMSEQGQAPWDEARDLASRWRIALLLAVMLEASGDDMRARRALKQARVITSRMKDQERQQIVDSIARQLRL